MFVTVKRLALVFVCSSLFACSASVRVNDPADVLPIQRLDTWVSVNDATEDQARMWCDDGGGLFVGVVGGGFVCEGIDF